MTCRLLLRRITKFRCAKTRAHQTLRLFSRLFSSGHLTVVPIAVASGFIAGSASVVVLLHRRMQPLYFLSTLAEETAFKVSK